MIRIWLAGLLVLLIVSQIPPGFWHGRSGVWEDGCTITNSLEQSAAPDAMLHPHVDSCHSNYTVTALVNNISLIVLFIVLRVTVPQNFSPEFSLSPATPPPRLV
ncbi:MAG: hypothetical protein IAF02_28785 [Anaerolineae bacterium]|nr:hypothetical protein [Anaerolineae bacterium]